MPDYIGQNTPVQVVKIRLGRFSRYWQDNTVVTEGSGENDASGKPTAPGHTGCAGHQQWDTPNYPCDAHVGTTASNPYYVFPWQALWIPTTEYAVVPNVKTVKLDKKLEIGGVGTAIIDVENIMYPVAEGAHVRERGYLAPLRGVNPPAAAGIPNIPYLEGEMAEKVLANEWEGRFAFAAQITIWQGTVASVRKVFTGLIEDIDLTARPDRISINCRDFGQVFSDTHFFGWGKDPIISTPVVFCDEEAASKKEKVGYNANSSDADKPTHAATKVIDGQTATSWQTNTVHSAEQTEYVEIALPEGRYQFADTHILFPGMEVFLALRPAVTAKGTPPRREDVKGGVVEMTIGNKWLDKNGWVDVTKKEEQLVPGVEGGNSYTNHIVSYGATVGQAERTPIDSEAEGGNHPNFDIGANSVLRISFRKLHKVEAGENFRAGLEELHGLRETLEAAVAKGEWVTTNDISDVVKVICQWAGFKEWDIEDTGAKLPTQITADPSKSWLDTIKELAESIGWLFYMKDPTPDGEPWKGASIEPRGGSLGVPTFREARAVSPDTKEELERLKKPVVPHEVGATGVSTYLPIITDRTLLTAIEVKQTNEPLASTIRVYGYTLAQVGHPEEAIKNGQRLVYLLRPPWAGTAPLYHDSRLGGVIKDFVYSDDKSFYLSTPEMVRNAAWSIALQQALESIQATIEVPGVAALGIDVEDHLMLMDLGTAVTTRMAAASVSSTFEDGEKRKFIAQITGSLIDTVDVREMVEIILGDKPANGVFNEWGNTRKSVPSELGYG